MKRKLMAQVIALMLMVTVNLWAADEGASLYKKKCSGCHGAGGEGKPSMKAPALKGTDRDVSQLSEHITKGEATSKAPHNKGISGLTGEQASSIAEYIKTLK